MIVAASTLGAGVALAEALAGVRPSRVRLDLVAGVEFGRAMGMVSALASVFVSTFRTGLLGRTGAEDMLPELASAGLRVVMSDDLGLSIICQSALVFGNSSKEETWSNVRTLQEFELQCLVLE